MQQESMQGKKHGLDPKKWGPPAWQLIHMIASVMETEEDRANFAAFIAAFGKVIPCSICKEHFAQNRQKFDIRNYMKDQESLLMWTFLIHDSVNHAQGKTGANRPDWLTIRSRYFKIDAGDENATPGTSEDYDANICTEICGATMAKLQSKTAEAPKEQMRTKILTQKSKKRR